MNARTRRGEIGLAISADLRRWTYCGIVLAEPFHLSYPYVFEWEGDLYMVPETWEAGSVRLYQAISGAGHWGLVDVLLEGPVHLDSSLFHHDGRWWMFSETDERFLFTTLRLYSAPHLRGPWIEHPRSPVVEHDAAAARPARRVIAWDGRLIRYAQDCRMTYGARANAFEITRLTDREYVERPSRTPVLDGTGTGWNRSCMHQVDAHQMADGRWMAFVDGH